MYRVAVCRRNPLSMRHGARICGTRRAIYISVWNASIVVAAGSRHHTGSGISVLSVSCGCKGTGLMTVTGNLIHLTGRVYRVSLRNTACDVI